MHGIDLAENERVRERRGEERNYEAERHRVDVVGLQLLTWDPRKVDALLERGIPLTEKFGLYVEENALFGMKSSPSVQLN